MEKNKLIEYLKCPMTKLIFCDPFIAEDGNLYEFMAIKNWLQKNSTSPITHERMGNVLIRATIVKKMVDEFLEENPEYKNERFLFKKPFYLFEKEFIEILKNKEFEKMKEFTTFMLNYEIGKETLIEAICKIGAPNDVIKHLIDNSIDYDMYDRKNIKPFHTICRYSNSEIIRHTMKKVIDFESEDHMGNRPISYLVLYQKDKDLIQDLLELGVNVNYENKQGLKLLHFIIINGETDLLKLFKNYSIDIASPCQKLNGLNPLQYAFRYAPSIEVVKYMIEQDYNIDIDPDPKITCEQLIYQNDNFTKKEKQQLVLMYLTKVLNKPVVFENYMESLIKEDDNNKCKV